MPGGLRLPNSLSMSSKSEMLWTHILPGKYRAVPSPLLLSASQPELHTMMHGETEKLLQLRRELEKEMDRISEGFISSNWLEVESYLDHIRKLKNNYQDDIEDFVEQYIEVLEIPNVLDEWTKEVMDIANIVKRHADKIRTRALQVSARPPPKPKPSQFASASEKAAMTKWLKDFTEKHHIGEGFEGLINSKSEYATKDKEEEKESQLAGENSWLSNILPFSCKEAALLQASDGGHWS